MKNRVYFAITFVFLLSILSFSFASAQGVGDNQTILLLSSSTNAHGALWNDTNYLIKVQYNTIFDSSYTGLNPHACSANNANIVLKLSGDTNAHAEDPDLNNYQTKVCYGDLICRSTNSACSSNEKLIVSLSDTTNAHLATDNSYGNNICCTSASAGGGGCPVNTAPCNDGSCNVNPNACPGGPTGGNGNPVCEPGEGCGDPACSGEQDRCEAGIVCSENVCKEPETKCPIGKTKCTVNGVKVCKNSCDPGEDPICNNNGICEINEGCTTSGGICSDCEYKQDSCDNGLACFSGSCQPRVCTDPTPNRCTDGTCQSSCSGHGGLAANNVPVTNITKPQNGAIYFVNTPINFSHNSYDIEDNLAGVALNIQWNISDSSFTNTAGNSVTWSYATPGQKIITLRVTDSQGASSEDQISILILSDAQGVSYGFSPSINKPFHEQVIVDNSLAVDYSGEESYVLKNTVSACSATIECLAGRCPTQTSGSLACSANPSAPISVSGTPAGYGALFFNWTFWDGTSKTIRAGQGVNFASGRQGYSLAGDKIIDLVLNYTDTSSGVSLQDKTRREFKLVGISQCSADGFTYYEIDSQGNTLSSQNTQRSAACVGPDTVNGTIDDCCQPGFSCSTNPANLGCRQPLSDITTQCSSYINQTNCENDPSKLAKLDPVYNILGCGTTIDGNNTVCSCNWYYPTNTCEFGTITRSSIDPENILSRCAYGSTLGECSEGYQNVNITVLSSTGPNPNCESKNVRTPCLRSTIQLPFFGAMQLMLSATAIALLYLIMFRTKSKKK